MVALITNCLITALVEGLGDDSYRVRQTSHKVLSNIVWLAAGHLAKGALSRDAEIAVRCKKLYGPVRFKEIEKAAFTLRDPMPWAWLDNHELTGYLEKAKERFGAKGGGPDWGDYRGATKLYIRDMLLSGKNLCDVNNLLNDWACRDDRWLDTYAHRRER